MHIRAYTCIYVHTFRARAVESLELERVELSTIIMPVSLAAAASRRRAGESEGTEPQAIQIRQWRSQTRVGQRPAVGKGQPLSKTE